MLLGITLSCAEASPSLYHPPVCGLLAGWGKEDITEGSVGGGTCQPCPCHEGSSQHAPLPPVRAAAKGTLRGSQPVLRGCA